MMNKKEKTASGKPPSQRQLKEARSEQYKGDYRFYRLFSQIWGWDGVKAEPEKAVKKLCRYIKWEERKRPVKRQRPRDPELQYYVGVAYLSNWIPCEAPTDYALEWFERSSAQGSDRGALGVGYLLEAALDTNWNLDTYKRMVEQYILAAKQGNIYGQYRLALTLHQWDPDNPRLGQMLMNAADVGYEPAKNLLSEINNLAKVKPQKLSSHEYDDISKKLEMLIEMGLENLIIARRMEQKLDMLQSSMNGMWDDLRAAETEHTDQITELQKSVNEALKDAIKLPRPKGCNPDIMVDAEKFMTLIFGEDWRNPERLCDESCDALVSAHVLMSVAEELKITNYSGIVITAVWALEHECCRRFRDSFDRHLQSQGIKAAEERALRMKLDYNWKEKNAKFTLGSVYCVVRPNSSKDRWASDADSDFEAFAEKCELLSDISKKIKKDKKYKCAGMVFWRYGIPGYTDDQGRDMSFTRIIQNLNDKYRTPAAHAKMVGKEMADECCNLLGITKKYQQMNKAADKKINHVEGALKALLWLTAPLEKTEK